MKKTVLLAALAITILSALFVFWNRPDSSVPAGKLSIAATIFPVYDLARSVAGDRARVELILPPGASPHTFEPSPGLVRRLAAAKAIFKIGLIDDWADGISPSGSVIRVDNGIELKKFDIKTFGEEEEEGNYDPHYWLTPKNAAIIARNIYGELSGLDPEGEPVYLNNLNALEVRLAALDAEIREELAPFRGSSIITFHDAFGYFADAYGLSIAAVFVSSPGKEMTPGDVKAVGLAAESAGAKAVFSEPQFPKDIIDSFASDFGLKVGILEADGGASLDDSYEDLMRRNVSNIVRALTR